MSTANGPWTLERDDFILDQVIALGARTSISVIIPARNEARTLGAVLDAVRQSPVKIGELLVVNDHSNDETPDVALRHGARVVNLEGSSGKGDALRAGLAQSEGELVVFLDGDVLNSSPDFVARLVQPLLSCDDIQLVKGYYERPLHDAPTGGGRVNELTARPILSLLFPTLAQIRQPLAGETAGRRSAFGAINLQSTYGVEIGLLIDIEQRFGVGSIAQVDLGVRSHRNRPLNELRPMAVDVLRAALSRYPVQLPPRSLTVNSNVGT